MANERFIFPPGRTCSVPIVGRRIAARQSPTLGTARRIARGLPREYAIWAVRKLSRTFQETQGGRGCRRSPRWLRRASRWSRTTSRDARALASSVRAQSSLDLVAEYRNGADALSGLASHAPDVLLVDLGLPDMSGLELIRFAAERYPDCDILVISIFGDEAQRARGAGGRGPRPPAEGLAAARHRVRHSGISATAARRFRPVIARQMLKRLRITGQGPAGKRVEGEEDAALTPREGEILNAISRGFSYAETAQMLGVSVGTVHSFLKRIYRKLAVHSKTEACVRGEPPRPDPVRRAIRLGAFAAAVMFALAADAARPERGRSSHRARRVPAQ